MHVPDGFLDAPTSVGTGVVAAAAVGVALRGRPARARRPYGAAGRPRRGVRLRHPDAQLPGRVRHQRPPARWRAGRGARRPVHRAAVHGHGLPRPVPALRRRRHHRARHQHRPDGAGHRRRRLDGLQDPPGGAAQAALDGGAGRRRRGARLGAGRRARLRAPLRGRRHRRPLARQPGHRDGRRARADRHRRGGDHRRSPSAASSPSAPTSCTAPARCSRSASSTSAAAEQAAA